MSFPSVYDPTSGPGREVANGSPSTPSIQIHPVSSVTVKRPRDADDDESMLDGTIASGRKRTETEQSSTTRSELTDAELMPPPSTIPARVSIDMLHVHLDSPSSRPPVPKSPLAPVRRSRSNPAPAGGSPTPSPTPAAGQPQATNALALAMGSQMTGTTRNTGLRDASEKPLKRKEFYAGRLFWAPHHCTALDPAADPVADPKNFAQSEHATICSKTRMMVVLWAYKTNILVLPLETHGKRGLAGVPDFLRYEFICLKHRYDHDFVNDSDYPDPLEATGMKSRLDEHTSVRLTTACTVDYKEKIELVGRLTTESTKRLQDLWLICAERAMDWRPSE